MPDDSDNIIFSEYKAHLEKEFISSHEGIITLKDYKVDIKNHTLSSQNLNLVLDEDVETTILDACGMQIHFLNVTSLYHYLHLILIGRRSWTQKMGRIKKLNLNVFLVCH